MAKCKICGGEFTPCRTDTPLNWRRVACCAEHGAIWFEKIEKARSNQPNIDASHNEELQSLLTVDTIEVVHSGESEPECSTRPFWPDSEDDTAEKIGNENWKRRKQK